MEIVLFQCFFEPILQAQSRKDRVGVLVDRSLMQRSRRMGNKFLRRKFNGCTIHPNPGNSIRVNRRCHYCQYLILSQEKVIRLKADPFQRSSPIKVVVNVDPTFKKSGKRIQDQRERPAADRNLLIGTLCWVWKSMIILALIGKQEKTTSA